jgi:hypothetical protein
MGVRKFRSVEDMPGPSPLKALDPENLRLAFSLMETTRRLGRLSYEPGVRKFHSLAEANAHRQAREMREAAKVRGENPPPPARPHESSD